MTHALTSEEMMADIQFLLARSECAGSCSFGSDRWTGLSSNSLVQFAYGGKHDCMPSDRSDYAACVRTVRRLPKHRRTLAVMSALRKAREAYLRRYPNDRSSLARRAARQEWERRERERWERKRRRR